MKDSNTNSINPRATNCSDNALYASTSSPNSDFGFAFDDSNFSDRVLRIEIVGDDSDEKEPSFARCRSVIDEARRKKEEKNIDHVLNLDSSIVMRVKTLHISSPILAAKSPLFYKMFSNDSLVTLHINASEEAALMELLNFIYRNRLSVTAPPALFNVLMIADKFEVSSCVRYCSKLLRTSSMSTESALLFLELPSIVSRPEFVHSLVGAAKHYISVLYKDITKYQEEISVFPLSGIEAILSSDELQVASEDEVFDIVLKWARTNYPFLEERREVLGARLARLIRFPYMSFQKLKHVLTCNDFDREVVSELVLDALFLKSDIVSDKQRSSMIDESIILKLSLHREDLQVYGS